MPSQKALEAKKEIVKTLVEKLSAAQGGVLLDYRGLTVEEETKLRAELRKAGVEYKVVKNTLLRFAAKEVGFDALVPVLNGPTSIAFSATDPIAPAKIICEFAKKNDKVELKSGFIEGRVISIDEVKAIADLPSKEVLVAKALAGFQAPIYGFVNVLNANLRGLVVALNQIAEKKAAAGE